MAQTIELTRVHESRFAHAFRTAKSLTLATLQLTAIYAAYLVATTSAAWVTKQWTALKHEIALEEMATVLDGEGYELNMKGRTVTGLTGEKQLRAAMYVLHLKLDQCEGVMQGVHNMTYPDPGA